jgi:tRNA-intron endonuclease
MATLLVGEKVIVTDNDLVSQLVERGYGENENGKLTLSPEESLYLMEKSKLVVKDPKDNEYGFKELLKYFAHNDKDFDRKYKVYVDLRDRGYIVRTGFKFGTHYRIYERGVKVGEGHAKWLVQVVTENTKFTMAELSGAVRLAQNVRKKMIYACVDKENEVTYYEFDRIKP